MYVCTLHIPINSRRFPSAVLARLSSLVNCSIIREDVVQASICSSANQFLGEAHIIRKREKKILEYPSTGRADVCTSKCKAETAELNLLGLAWWIRPP